MNDNSMQPDSAQPRSEPVSFRQALLFWRKHELLGAFKTWQAWTAHMLHLKSVAVSVVKRMCFSCQVQPAMLLPPAI